MEYVPSTHTNGEYRRLGDRIRQNPDNVSSEDLMILQDLRVTFKEPLAIIFKEIEKMAIKVDKECICTYRVKRIESIISKLKRLPQMQLDETNFLDNIDEKFLLDRRHYILYSKTTFRFLNRDELGKVLSERKS